MIVQITKETGKLCGADGVPVSDELRNSPLGAEAWASLACHAYGVTIDLDLLRAGMAARAERAVRLARVRAMPSGSAMLCSACGDAVPCRQTRRGWVCDDCAQDR